MGRSLEGGWSVIEGEVPKTVPDFSTTRSSANGDNNNYRLGMATPMEEVFSGRRNSCSCKFYGGYTGFGSTNAATRHLDLGRGFNWEVFSGKCLYTSQQSLVIIDSG